MDKFSYKLKDIKLRLDTDELIKEYLNSLGIEKIDSFLEEPSVYDEENPENLDNIHALVDALHKGFKENKTFFMQIDSDVDGYTSASIFYRYFMDLYPEAKIEYRVHNGKEHGVILNTVPVYADYVIIPDAGSNQFDEQYELTASGKTVLVIDHHHVDEFNAVKGCIVVNNQLSKNFKNKFLSGAGMVYKVIQLYSKKYHDNEHHRQYIDLAAFGIISDMMDTRELDNNYIIYHGLRNIKNPMLQAILNKQAFSVSSTTKPNKIDIAFYITPLVNAVVRVGTVNENLSLFKGFTEYNHDEVYERTFRGKTTTETYYDMMARISYNIRNQQNKEKEKGMEFLANQISDNGLDKNTVIAVIASNDDDVLIPKTMTGLVAMDIVKNYKKPTLVLRPKVEDGKNYYYGSGRANMRPGFPSFRDTLNESGLVKFAEGHDMAFGVGISENNLPKLIKYLNEKLKTIDFGSEEIEVDAILRGKDISHRILGDFAKYKDLYGNGIPQPKFAFELLVDKDMIDVIGKDKTTIKFNYNGIEFIKFNSKEIINEIFSGDEKTDDFFAVSPKLRFKIVGRSQYNEFNGSRTLQVTMDNVSFEISKAYSLL